LLRVDMSEVIIVRAVVGEVSFVLSSDAMLYASDTVPGL